MVNKDLMEEIRAMSNEGKMSQEEAMRLILRANVAIMEKLDDTERRLAVLEDVHEDHPSLMWLWEYRPQKAFKVTMVYVCMGIGVLSPVIISDIRQPLLAQLMAILRSALLP